MATEITIGIRWRDIIGMRNRLVHDYDRKRAAELFEFEFMIEFYKPKTKRRWGYFVMPVLHHDRLVGKIDIAADRQAGRLVAHAIHPDVPFTAAIKAGIDAELHALAAWLHLDRVSIP